MRRWLKGFAPAPWVLLIPLLTLVLSLAAWHYAGQATEQSARVEFEAEVSDSMQLMDWRIQSYLDALHSAQSLMTAGNVSRATWDRYVQELDLPRRHPGIKVISFIRYVPAAGKAEFERRVQADGYPEFAIIPPGDRPDYLAVEYISPFAANIRAFGFDIGSERERRAAAERARDSGEAALTGQVSLVMQPADRTGFVMLLPVYGHDKPHESVPMRREALTGYVATVMQMGDVMEGLLSGARGQKLAIEVYADMGDYAPDQLIYSSGSAAVLHRPGYRPRYEETQQMSFGGQTWVVHFATLPGFRAGLSDDIPRLVLLGGLVISLLSFGVLWSLGRSRTRAVRLAEAMTAGLRASEERFRSAFGDAAIGMALVDPNGFFIQVNRSLAAMLGYEADELVGRHFKEITHRDDLDADLQNVERLLRGQATHYHMEKRYLHRDGRAVWILLSVSLVRDAGGRPAQFISQMQDISGRKRAEAERQRYAREVERRHAELRSLIQHMAEGVVAVDEHGQILLVNAAASRLLGLHSVSPDLDRLPDPLREALLESAHTGSDAAFTFPHQGAELRANVAPVAGEEEQLSGAVALLQDVTASIELERLRENFVAHVSHDLRGPLASLSAVLEAMRDELIPPEKRPRYFQALLGEIDRLRRLTDDLLELTRLKAGVGDIPLEEFDLHPLCESLVERMGIRATGSGIDLAMETPHLRVLANYDRVEQILSNLVENALRFTPSGGSVRVRAEQLDGKVSISVADTGVGIEKKHLPFVWDRFYTADPARTRTVQGGTGLGLAIVKELVGRLGGEVAVESEPGEGTVFSFTLPAAGGD